mgnify:CR=1 FL=1
MVASLFLYSASALDFASDIVHGELRLHANWGPDIAKIPGLDGAEYYLFLETGPDAWLRE